MSEAKASNNVERQGHETYLPRFVEQVSHRGRRVARERLLFPRYLFIRTSESWRWLLSTIGVSGVVMGAGIDTPARLPGGLVEAMREMEDRDGRVVLPKEPRFTHGQSVRLTRGCFSGCLGIYAGASSFEREGVLLDILGRSTPITVGAECLVAA